MLLLLNPWVEITTFATRGILSQLWKVNIDDDQTIFLGYLLLRSKYDELRTDVIKHNRKNDIHDYQETHLVALFKKKFAVELEKVIKNKITFADLGDLSKLGFTALEVVFELIPPNTQLVDHKVFLNIFLPLSAQVLDRDHDEVNLFVKQRFIKKLVFVA